jgi:hypothetical protein
LQPASGLNPEAGDHPITSDPRELAASLRASERTLAEFPYYHWRYGERGVRFSNSDSAWLAHVCSLPAARARQQISWLGAVLSSRGMPLMLLEHHLLIMRDELAAAVPEKRRVYAALTRNAAHLRRARLAAISARKAESIAAAFTKAAPNPWRARIPEMGSLLVAAVADERNGIERAVLSMEEWVYDKERFPPSWIRAARAAIAAARD